MAAAALSINMTRLLISAIIVCLLCLCRSSPTNRRMQLSGRRLQIINEESKSRLAGEKKERRQGQTAARLKVDWLNQELRPRGVWTLAPQRLCRLRGGQTLPLLGFSYWTEEAAAGGWRAGDAPHRRKKIPYG